MNERYLFRGKNDGEWFIGSLHVCSKTNHHHIIGKFAGDEVAEINLVYNDVVEVDPATVGQCTGLSAIKSYRGSRPEDLLIFEGDIVKGIWGCGGYAFIVKWVGAGFFADSDSFAVLKPIAESPGIKIIGNIHDNRVEDV